MIKKALKTLKRAPVRAVAVLLFAAVITMIICALHASNEAELSNYEETWKSVPITVTVTKPSGADTDLPFSVKDWVFFLFTGEEPVQFLDTSAAENIYEAAALRHSDDVDSIELSLSEYVKDVQFMASRQVKMVGDMSFRGDAPFLCGMTSLSCDKQLLPDYGCVITWKEGYDESIFAGEELVCIIPESAVEDYDNGNGEITLSFTYRNNKYQCTLKIVGTYTAGDEKSIYCPYPIYEQVRTGLGDDLLKFDSMSATLADNSRLSEFREKAKICFLDPSPHSEQIRWGFFANNWYNEFYDYALDIADENLFDLSAILEESIKFNRTVTVFVVILSVVAGFLVGFLMIRRRKRDIILMRTVGESNFRLYIGFVLEQMICVILGIAVGGAYYKWNPMDKLILFAIVYFAALTLALAIFMSKKLITNIKEDE